ncbi:hypothetical protein NEOLI_003637 [Neolecta irregularis DAH-3]|uniref:Uncharacterized protein n=1 Tax=Neolecta irregularis (strain DAH-3) TaxID=1198029 RepID=A0A1U7LSY7_NEOID|nr:hypothetical protein NEOLI_003637 [Neolecta irregularis DAH-3]|eukprot:OLL25786.1 hypothetical protein NEOLI_003637 [Neolecta irregularis DAH-3]
MSNPQFNLQVDGQPDKFLSGYQTAQNSNLAVIQDPGLKALYEQQGSTINQVIGSQVYLRATTKNNDTTKNIGQLYFTASGNEAYFDFDVNGYLRHNGSPDVFFVGPITVDGVEVQGVYLQLDNSQPVDSDGLQAIRLQQILT